MGHIYRCNACRTRNQFRRRVGDYLVPRRCRHCGHTRFYVDRERVARKPCYCAGYHHAHRPGSRCCELHPLHVIHRLARAGAEPEEIDDVRFELSLAGPAARRHPAGAPCPF